MVVIISELFRFPAMPGKLAAPLNEYCKSAGLNEPVNVNSEEALREKLQEYKGEQIILLSNFPPDSSYRRATSAKSGLPYQKTAERPTEGFSYERSNSLFRELCAGYNFRAIHFITGAPDNSVNIGELVALFPETMITMIRKNEFLGEGQSYHSALCDYMIRRIRESV